MLGQFAYGPQGKSDVQFVVFHLKVTVLLPLWV